MSTRKSLSLFVLSLALCTPNLPLLHAQEPAPPTAPAPPAGENNGENRPRREGSPRDGAPREGGPRREGGGPGEGGGPRGDGPREGETPEQYRARVLAPYVEMVPDLSDAQKTHILAILDAASAESRAARADTSLSEARQRAVGRAIRDDLPRRVKSALTETQLSAYELLLAEQAENAAAMSQVVTVRQGEDLEQMRARVTKGYEEAFEALSIKQKTRIIKILEVAGENSAAINADTTKTAAQKNAALLQIHNSIDAQVAPLLDADQKAAWKKAHDAHKPAA